MGFTNVFKSNPIQTFELTVASNDVAFGPGSIINGSIKLFVEKSVKAKSIRVLFKCEEWEQGKDHNALFSIESTIWDQKEEDAFLEVGSHIYLFAIQLPATINYPPAIKDVYLGHRIEYSLQGYLDVISSVDNSSIQTRPTSVVSLIYLPLVTVSDDYIQKKEKTVKIEKGSEYVEITANLVNPSSCPVSTTTSYHSKSENHPDLPTSGPSYRHKQRQILYESFYITIPKFSRNNTVICPIRIPSFCVPTTQSHFGKYIGISYEIFIIIPAMGNYPSSSTSVGVIGVHNNSFSHLLLNPHVIRLPLFISTIPYYTPRLKIPFADNETSADLPTFIISNESPNLLSHSPSADSDCNWGPGSPVDLPEDDELVLPQPQEDASGHLMVPSSFFRRPSSSN
ncbi:MAG: hypothetical protein EXX96DRAFT_593451 [Benjaminiella poitrasii]|nr:MAG: hypothetical protein EXX96DRAFT_593451 [Benjaminiella poitrasii]